MPLFVTFEGIEGAGKSTQLRKLAAHLHQRGISPLETREPGGTAAGSAIRQLLLGADAVPLTPVSELLLLCADRAQHIAETIRPALAAGQLVLCDRFSDSTIAYQGHGRGLDLTMVRTMDAAARDGVWPDVTFLLDCPVEDGLRRAAARHSVSDRFERETVSFHERIRAGFQSIATADPGRVVTIDAAADNDTVHRQIVTVIDQRLAQP